VSIALDCGASEFFRDGVYDYGTFETAARGARHTTAQRDSRRTDDYLGELVSRYRSIRSKDGMSEREWAGWTALTQRLIARDLSLSRRRLS
jgi:enolase